MKYLTFIIVILIGIFISSCTEGHTYTEVYEYLTLINYDGSSKVQLSEDNPGKTFFYQNDDKLVYKWQNEILSIDLNSMQFETIFPFNNEEWYISNYEMFPNLLKIIFWDGTNERDLYLFTLDTGIVENLTNTLEKKEDSVKLSPSEELFVYIEKDYTFVDSIKWSIRYRNFEGNINETVTSKFQTCGTTYNYVDWIDDNTLIYVNDEFCLSPGLYTVNFDGSENQLIHSGLYIKYSICKDRSKIIFEDEYELYLIDTTSLSVSSLKSGSKPLISPDGNKLAYYDDIFDLVVWDMVEDTTTLISKTPYSSAIGFSSDSQKLVFNEQIIVTYHRDKRIM